MSKLLAPVAVIDRAADALSQILKYLAALLLVLIGILIAADVILRSIFNLPLIGVAEIVANSVVLIAFLQLGYTIRLDGMLRSEALDRPLGVSGRVVMRVVACLLGAIFFGLIAWASWSAMVAAVVSGEFEGHSGFRIPTAPTRIAIVAFSLFGTLNYLLVGLRTALRGELTSAPEAGGV